MANEIDYKNLTYTKLDNAEALTKALAPLLGKDFAGGYEVGGFRFILQATNNTKTIYCCAFDKETNLPLTFGPLLNFITNNPNIRVIDVNKISRDNLEKDFINSGGKFNQLGQKDKLTPELINERITNAIAQNKAATLTTDNKKFGTSILGMFSKKPSAEDSIKGTINTPNKKI